MGDTPVPQATSSHPLADADTVDLPAGATPEAPAAGPSPATVRSFGNYEILDEIDRGGMGVVFKARERHSGLLVALKMMLGASTGGSGRQRFILEARATGELHHPGVVAIHAWGEHDGQPFYTMDFVPGVTLGRVLAGGPLPCEKAVRYLVGIARAVAAAHSLGIVHRDLKPNNVIIDLSDQPRVLDFGLAKRHRRDPARPGEDDVPEVLPVTEEPSPPTLRQGSLTETGAILGTPSYMAPEQVRAEHDRVGPPADVHALGAIFYEMVTGRPPFQAQSTYDTLMQVIRQEPVPLRRLSPRAPAALEEFCQRCLAKEAAQRYPDAGALAEDLERRWQRATQGQRFARLTLAAGLVLLGLFLLQRLFGALVPDWLGVLPHAVGPLQAVAEGLVVLFGLLVFVAAPYLAEVGLLTWAAAWVWKSERPREAFLSCLAAALGALALSGWGPLEGLREGPVYLGGLLVFNALVVGGVGLARWWTGRVRDEADATRPSDPYLQKLFAVRVEARPRGTGRADAEDNAAVGLANLELGKTLHRWGDNRVCWARQKALDRAVLVWFDRAATGPIPGVVVRHPDVLALHAAGTSPEGRFLVTEPAAASPLAELLQQRGLVPLEAAALTARLARAVQAFHDQGAVHGRLSPDWVLVRGDLDPLLCPCGVPGQAPQELAADVAALGRQLTAWLPDRPGWWQRRILTPLYEAGRAAAGGAYARAADLADDLDRAAWGVRLRWRERWANLLVLFLLLLPVLFPVAVWALAAFELVDPPAAQELARPGGARVAYGLLALLPCTLLLGYVHARSLVHRFRLRHRGRLRDPVLRSGVLTRLIQLGPFALLAVAVAWYCAVEAGGRGALGGSVLLVACFAGFWLLGACLGGLVTYGEVLVASVHSLQPAGGKSADPV
jgi:Protein kinase domain